MTRVDEETTVGRSIPVFHLPKSTGGTLTNTDLLGKRTIMYFYPKDNTPGCTIEAKEFSAALSQFTALGVAVYGISGDSVKSHEKFANACQILFPLLSDESHQFIEALGAWGERAMYGRIFMGALRNTLVIGGDGKVQMEWKRVKAPGHAKTVLSALQ